jgi:hypothetical protein
MADQISYRVGAASLFVGYARTVKYICGWCGKPGEKASELVEGVLVPAEHVECKGLVQAAAKSFCYCFEVKGDNADCPVHGGK